MRIKAVNLNYAGPDKNIDIIVVKNNAFGGSLTVVNMAFNGMAPRNLIGLGAWRRKGGITKNGHFKLKCIEKFKGKNTCTKQCDFCLNRPSLFKL